MTLLALEPDRTFDEAAVGGPWPLVLRFQISVAAARTSASSGSFSTLVPTVPAPLKSHSSQGRVEITPTCCWRSAYNNTIGGLKAKNAPTLIRLRLPFPLQHTRRRPRPLSGRRAIARCKEQKAEACAREAILVGQFIVPVRLAPRSRFQGSASGARQ
jgi:hypothetical protein